ncbi:hypothetical protein DW646_18165 [Bacteroides sp. AM23-18]|jgi:hypothetical protein|nr:hypothetical protein DW646_18165 [Bacteroides sp. AM23-18]
MTISDFLVLVTIVLTLVTIAVSNNKKIWLYKFYKRDYYLLFLGFVYRTNSKADSPTEQFASLR